MAKQINKLSPELANQIAAGEVVERPASVVKELLENSLDAGATQITIDIEQGGVGLIRIRDNGCGISKEDLPLALASHATSKINTVEDLNHLQSLGFRGEALASISSVSRLTLISRVLDAEYAWQVQVEGRDRLPQITPAAHEPGTCVEVRDLFYNTPARRNFLRSEKTELSHIEEVVKKIALSHFEVTFNLNCSGRCLLSLGATKNADHYTKRIDKIFGKQFAKQARAIEFNATGIKLWGWLGMPAFSRSQTDLQYTFVNGRVVRDRLLNHSIRQAYGDLIYPGRYPCYLLYLEVEPEVVDVNVHPTKHEVRFRDSRLIHDFIAVHLASILNGEKQQSNSTVFPEKDFLSHTVKVAPALSYYEARESQSNYVALKNKVSQVLKNEGEIKEKVIGSFKDRFLLVEREDKLVIIDRQKAYELIAIQQLTQGLQQGTLISQPLLIPLNLTFSSKVILQFQSNQQQFADLGVELQILSETTLLVRKLPSLLRELDVTEAFSELAREEKQLSNHRAIIEKLAYHYGLNKKHVGSEFMELLEKTSGKCQVMFTEKELLAQIKT